jgi:acyl-CoA thioester hydrolase
VTTLPTATQVRQLPAKINRAVAADYIDENGHMSLPHYITVAAQTLWERQREIGLATAFDVGLTSFAAEQHARYLAELRLGDRLTGHVRVLARSDRAMHSITYVLDASRDRLACTVEGVNVFVSMANRRSTTLPDDIAAGLDADIAAQSALPWSADTCGSLWRRRTE